MKSYNYQRISDLITPLMDMMREEYPNNAELIITSDFAKIQYALTDMNFMRKNETIPPEAIDDMAKALGNALKSFCGQENENTDNPERGGEN
mgnify:CR=1 FL=1